MTDTEGAVAPQESQRSEASWPTVEARATTVDEAIARGLSELGAESADVVIEVVSRPAQALPGERVSGAGEALVRVTRIDERTARARATLAGLLELMEIPARITVRRQAPTAESPEPPPILDVSGDDLGLLIGWRGETLRALQTVVNLMMGDEEPEAGRRVILDVERYRARREEQVKELALRLANRVKRTGQRYTLDPMHAYERRAIHLALAGDDDVRTESSGKEPARRVVIHPTGPAQPDLPEIPDRAGRPPRRGFGDRDRDRGPRRPRF